MERWNRLHPAEPAKKPDLQEVLEGTWGPIIAASDYMKVVQDQIAQWVPGRFVALGTDGFGRSDNRAHLRKHFEVDAAAIVVATLSKLCRMASSTRRRRRRRLRIWRSIRKRSTPQSHKCGRRVTSALRGIRRCRLAGYLARLSRERHQVSDTGARPPAFPRPVSGIESTAPPASVVSPPTPPAEASDPWRREINPLTRAAKSEKVIPMKWLLVLMAVFAMTFGGRYQRQLEGTAVGNGPIEETFTFKVDGTKLTGETASQMLGKSTITDGKIEGDNITFQHHR